jgi:release factor glutamine methyltransferase
MSGRPSIELELREGTRALDQAGILNPKREATAIWASLIGVQLGDVWLMREDEALADHSLRFKEAVERRARGEPLPYVAGVTGFRKLSLKVDRRVLIPRPETEGLVERVLEWCRSRERGSESGWGIAVDVCTGSGNIALSLAVEGEFDRVIATDSSADALDVAADNHRSLTPRTPVEFVHGNLLDSIGDTVADVIVSNPPYVSTAEYAGLDVSVRNFEPHTALVSGVDGMDHTTVLLQEAKGRLLPGGLIAIEVDSTRAGAVLDLAAQVGWQNARVEADLFGRSRFFLANKET